MECVLAKKYANRYLRMFLSTKTTEDRKEYVQYRNTYKQLVRDKKVEYRRSMSNALFITCIRDSGRFWRHVKTLGTKYRVSCRIPLEVLHEYFRNVFSTAGADDQDDFVMMNVNCFPDDNGINSPITGDEVTSAIRHLKVVSSAGTDEIIAEKCSKHLSN